MEGRYKLALGLSLLLAVPALAQLNVAPQPCTPEFPYQGGWLGGDSGYSIPLSDRESLWLFGDSFVGGMKTKDRVHAKMVTQTIGFSNCDVQGRWTIRYYWAGHRHKDPMPVFVSGTRAYKYWVLDGFRHHGKIYVALTMIKDRPDIAGAFNWEAIGTRLARISDVEQPPAQWKIEYLDLFRGKVYPGTAIAVEGDYAYFFALAERDPQHSPVILTRLSLAALEGPAMNLQYLGKDGRWKDRVNADDAQVVMEDGASEMTVSYHRGLKRWIAVSLESIFLSNRVILRTAPALTGPWSRPTTIYEIPEMRRDYPLWDKETWCYAAKEHKEFARENEILITYACNSFNFSKLVANTEIYVPRAVWVPLPK